MATHSHLKGHTMRDTTDEALAILRDSGLLTEMQIEARRHAETERATLLLKIQEIEQRQLEELPALRAVIESAEIQKREAERLLAEAIRAGLEAHSAHDPLAYSLEHGLNRARGKMMQLADPRIKKLQTHLKNLARQVNDSFQIWTEKEPTFTGVRRIERSNSTECNAAIEAIGAATRQLESLKYAPFPEDFETAVRDIFMPVEMALQALRINANPIQVITPEIQPATPAAQSGWMQKFTNLIQGA
jgi:hypothetical protein